MLAQVGSVACQDHPFGVVILLLICWCSVVVQSRSLGVLVLRPLARSSCAGQDQPLPVTGPGLLCRSYTVICSWTLSVLDLEVVGEAMLSIEASHHKCRPRAARQKAQGTLKTAPACQLPIKVSC